MYYVSVYHPTRQYRMCHFRENSMGYMTQTTASEHWRTMTSQLKSLPFSRSLSETIRKPPLVKAQTALKDKKLDWPKTIFNMAHKIITPCNVACGSGIMTPKFTKWHHPAMWYVALGWHAMEFAETSAIFQLYIWFRFWPYHRSQHVILHQFVKFYQNRTTLSRKNVDFQDGGPQPSWMLGFQLLAESRCSRHWRNWPSAYRVPNMLLCTKFHQNWILFPWDTWRCANMVPVRHVQFSKFTVNVTLSPLPCYSAFLFKTSLKSDNCRLSYDQKSNFFKSMLSNLNKTLTYH